MIGDFIGVSEGTELNYISDFSYPSKTTLSALLARAGIPSYVYSLEDAKKRQLDHSATEPCPRFSPKSPDNFSRMVPGDEIVIRSHALPFHKSHRTLLAWVEPESFGELLELFDSSVLWCEQYKDMGLYHRNSQFLVLSDSSNATKVVFENDNIRKHRRVASVVPLGDDGHMFAFWSPDIFGKEEDGGVLNYVWTKDKRFASSEEAFANLDDFRGFELIVHLIPWSYSTQGTLIPDEEGGTDLVRYRDYWGAEIDMTDLLKEKLNFTYVIRNNPTELWGSVSEESGEWIGLVKDAADGECDFIMGPYLNFKRIQVRS